MVVIDNERAAIWIGSDSGPVQDCFLNVSLPAAMKEAVKDAARRRNMSAAKYTRAALVAQLREDEEGGQ